MDASVSFFCSGVRFLSDLVSVFTFSSLSLYISTALAMASAWVDIARISSSWKSCTSSPVSLLIATLNSLSLV